MPRDTREPQEILDHITRAWVALTTAIYGLSEEQLTQAGAVGKWSVKNVMAHIGRWESVCFEILHNHLQGKQPERDYSQFLALNDEWESELLALSLPQSIELFETAHHHLFGFLSSLKPEQWNGYIRAWVTGSTWHHYEEHAEHIRTWRKTL
jgi:DinB superfamily